MYTGEGPTHSSDPTDCRAISSVHSSRIGREVSGSAPAGGWTVFGTSPSLPCLRSRVSLAILSAQCWRHATGPFGSVVWRSWQVEPRTDQDLRQARRLAERRDPCLAGRQPRENLGLHQPRPCVVGERQVLCSALRHEPRDRGNGRGNRRESLAVGCAAGIVHLSSGEVVEQIPWRALGHVDHATHLIGDAKRGGLWLGFFRGGIAFFKDGEVRESYGTDQG